MSSNGIPGPIYSEDQVPRSYKLPPLMEFSNGVPVQTAADWTVRRAELLQLFRNTMYGTCPDPLVTDYSTTSCKMTYEVLSNDPSALNGLATRREIKLQLENPKTKKHKEWRVLLYIPNTKNKNKSSIPCFLGLNFAGNHAIHPDPGITKSRIVEGEEHFECERGFRARKWQVERVMKRGFALATVYSGEIEPDNPRTAFSEGVHRLLFVDDTTTAGSQTDSTPSSWGTLAAWSWGLSRTLDLLEEIPEIDAQRVAVIGHSRKGKAALWAGAEDPRFAMVVSNNSGCGGAALSRRKFGETLALMNERFPTWLCKENRQYTEETLPVDQHQLIALIAPRPVYVASAVDDLWADPRGEFQSVKYGEPAYKILGCSGLDYNPPEDLSALEDAPIDKPLHGSRATMGYHRRTGDHDVLAYDWDQYLDFAERHLKAKQA